MRSIVFFPSVGLYGDHVAGYEERQNKMKQRAEQVGLGSSII